jgi:hypothetical protein
MDFGPRPPSTDATLDMLQLAVDEGWRSVCCRTAQGYPDHGHAMKASW